MTNAAHRDLGPREHYGLQHGDTWGVGNTDPKTLVDATPPRHLWRVSCIGSSDLRAQLRYGTSGSVVFGALLLPVVAYVPGNVGLTLAPLTASAATEAQVSLTPVSSAGQQLLRTQLTAGDVVPVTGAWYTALTASTLTVGGVVTAVAASARIPVFGGVALTAGDGILEHEI